jgi:hypothetical protein
VPFLAFNSQSPRKVAQQRHGIVFRIDGVRQNQDIRHVPRRFIYSHQLCFHDRANGPAGCEKKISDVNLPQKRFVRNGSAVLIYESKRGNGVEDSIRSIGSAFPENGELFIPAGASRKYSDPDSYREYRDKSRKLPNPK